MLYDRLYTMSESDDALERSLPRMKRLSQAEHYANQALNLGARQLPIIPFWSRLIIALLLEHIPTAYCDSTKISAHFQISIADDYALGQ